MGGSRVKEEVRGTVVCWDMVSWFFSLSLVLDEGWLEEREGGGGDGIDYEKREREIRDHAILSSRLSIPLVISSNMIDPLTQTHRSPKFVRRKREQRVAVCLSGCHLIIA